MNTPDGHTQFTLSILDKLMVNSVSVGGNWKDIPNTIPSKRLDQIRLTGGRTTLYGRLAWDRPSYTITTYIGRPGNGCHIHPSGGRLITPLEAARLQGFPDSFSFKGSKNSRAKQIGNAVPSLLGYVVAKNLKKLFPNLINTVDLFSGAGGLTLGFKQAGFKCLAANDNMRDAGATFTNNFPDSKFILGDITLPYIKKNLYQAIKGEKVDIVIGGPPCQGFSYAGKRMIDDPRNILYKEFVKIVSKLKPKIFVMENVEGILTSNDGKTFNSIKDDFEALGYKIQGKKINAASIGLPQKRKRVIVIGIRTKKKTFPDLLSLEFLEEGNFTTVKEAIGNIPFKTKDSVTDIVKINKPKSSYQNLMAGLVTFEEFIDTLQTKYQKSI